MVNKNHEQYLSERAIDQMVSVIVTAYNCAPYLEKCILSVFEQYYSDFEVILIDDCSDDGSTGLIDSLIKSDPRLSVVRNRYRLGVSASRNLALNLAKGDYVAFVDGDDWLDPTMLQRLFEYRNDQLVMCSYYRAYSKKIISRDLILSGRYKATFFRKHLACPSFGNVSDPTLLDIYSTVWGKLYSRQLINRLNLKFRSLSEVGTGEDFLFNLEYLGASNHVRLINEPLYYYRRDNVSSTTSKGNESLARLWKNKNSYAYRLVGNDSALRSRLRVRTALQFVWLALNAFKFESNEFRKFRRVKALLLDDEILGGLNELDISQIVLAWRPIFFFAKHRLYFLSFLSLRILDLAVSSFRRNS
tara:strand:+ start:19180 stop:20259 length:1080 start_codon:yes stop_codon:yes gene_type:complete